MMRLLLVITFAALAAAASVVKQIPEPGKLAYVLSEDDFEDYLDAWLENEYLKTNYSASAAVRSGCTLRVQGDLGQPQPVFISSRDYLNPTGNSGQIQLNTGQQVTIACTGPNQQIQHANLISNLAVGTVSCVNTNLVQASWLRGNSAFGGLTCNSDATNEAHRTSSRCWNNNFVIRVGFIVQGVFYPLYWSCFDQRRLEVIYVWYPQTPENAVHQNNVDRTDFLAGTFFPEVDINNLYTQNHQSQRIAQLTGINSYVTSTQFLSRGHLAAKSDFVFATGQIASFYFINVAPQWQPINAGNWNTLEQRLRARIAEVGYHTTIYTGTFGVTKLRNIQNALVDIYLHTNNQLPVPEYYYKVVYDATRRLGTAFITINNPHYTQTEAGNLVFCADQCRSTAFNWIGWEPDNVGLGYSFCCSIDDFRRIIQHLPPFTVNGLLT